MDLTKYSNKLMIMPSFTSRVRKEPLDFSFKKRLILLFWHMVKQAQVKPSHFSEAKQKKRKD